jgi:hypothetical protein
MDDWVYGNMTKQEQADRLYKIFNGFETLKRLDLKLHGEVQVNEQESLGKRVSELRKECENVWGRGKCPVVKLTR